MELARLAAAKRQALELYIEDLNKNLNSNETIFAGPFFLEFAKPMINKSLEFRSNFRHQETSICSLIERHVNKFGKPLKFQS